MENKEVIYNSRKVAKGKAWLLFLFFGWSYGSFNKPGKQILFYLRIEIVKIYILKSFL